MSSMPISRKRNNNSRRTKILVSILGFLCLSVLISGCSRTPKNNAGQSDGTGSAVLTSSLSEEQLAHVKECNGRRVSSDQPVELVVMNGGKPEPFAVLQPGQLVQLKEINDPNLITSQYLPLDGMDQEGGAQVLVNALEVTPSGRWLNPTNHLLEKDFAVKLKAGTRMLDDNGETILTTSTDQQWLVYAQKDGAYGVELQGRIVWVDSAQVEETIARSDSGGPAATSLPVLMYHDLTTDPSKTNSMTVTDERFRLDMEFLQQFGYTPLLPADLINIREGKMQLPDKAVMVTFDDGYRSNYDYAYPVLQNTGMKAAIAVVAHNIRQEGDADSARHNMTWDELREMVDSGAVEVGSHTYNLHNPQYGGNNAPDGINGVMRLKGESRSAYNARVGGTRSARMTVGCRTCWHRRGYRSAR